MKSFGKFIIQNKLMTYNGQSVAESLWLAVDTLLKVSTVTNDKSANYEKEYYTIFGQWYGWRDEMDEKIENMKKHIKELDEVPPNLSKQFNRLAEHFEGINGEMGTLQDVVELPIHVFIDFATILNYMKFPAIKSKKRKAEVIVPDIFFMTQKVQKTPLKKKKTKK